LGGAAGAAAAAPNTYQPHNPKKFFIKNLNFYKSNLHLR
jgi:hypothetical protein